EQPDEKLGLARAKTAALVMLALPGSAYIYQGEELGLPEHTTLPDEARQDPSFFRTGGAERGRDGPRVPLPGRAGARGYGWGPAQPGPWLPQPESFGQYAADLQVGVPGSTYEFYRSALRLRAERGLGRGSVVWSAGHNPEAGILSYRNQGLLVLANMGREPQQLPAGYRVVPASGPGAAANGSLAPDAAVWLLPAEASS
ncbi:alpha-amylase, partial [Arthrobacter deserti]|nr:alpha-amylase [Arthrobacter deserti]